MTMMTFSRMTLNFSAAGPVLPPIWYDGENSTEDDVPLDAATASEAPAAPQAASDSPDEVVNQAATLKRLEPRQPVTPRKWIIAMNHFTRVSCPAWDFPRGTAD
jgi:hypothetical protein